MGESRAICSHPFLTTGQNMKKFIITLVLALVAVASNAQSFQLHQSYDDNQSAWGSTRLISDYFWTSGEGRWNVFSWNSFSQNGISGLLYGECAIGESGLYAHAEVRTQLGNFDYNRITPELGFAYLVWAPGLSVYFTPKYVYNDVYFSKHDFQFSVNSSYENDWVYYEGYLDTSWVKGFNLFTEQKVYYKLTDNFQLGLCLVANATRLYDFNEGFGHLQPYVSLRVSLY